MVSRRVVLWVALAVSLSCAGHPTATYPGPELPRAEVAILRGSANARVLAIDDTTVSLGSWSLLPGPHTIWLQVRVFTEAPNVNWTIWSYCTLTLRAIAGEEYTSRVRMQKEVVPGLADNVKMEIGIADSQEILRAAVNSCVADRPKFAG